MGSSESMWYGPGGPIDAASRGRRVLQRAAWGDPKKKFGEKQRILAEKRGLRASAPRGDPYPDAVVFQKKRKGTRAQTEVLSVRRAGEKKSLVKFR